MVVVMVGDEGETIEVTGVNLEVRNVREQLPTCADEIVSEIYHIFSLFFFSNTFTGQK